MLRFWVRIAIYSKDVATFRWPQLSVQLPVIILLGYYVLLSHLGEKIPIDHLGFWASKCIAQELSYVQNRVMVREAI